MILMYLGHDASEPSLSVWTCSSGYLGLKPGIRRILDLVEKSCNFLGCVRACHLSQCSDPVILGLVRQPLGLHCTLKMLIGDFVTTKLV